MGGIVSSIFGSPDTGPGMADVQVGNVLAKRNLLYGNPKYLRGKSIEQGAVPGLDIRTPYSSVDAATGTVSLDPKAREELLSSYNTFTSSLGETRNSLVGNQGAFMQARVNPMLEKLAAGRGLLNRELNRTNVRGTIRNRELESYDIAGERAVGDQRALATQESLNAINAIDQLLFNAGTGVSTNLFNQQMQELGFGLDTINIINSLANNLSVGAANIAQRSAQAGAMIDQANIENILGIAGAGLTAYGSLGSTASAGGTGHGVGSMFP